MPNEYEISEEEIPLLDSEISPLQKQVDLNDELSAAAQNEEIYMDEIGATIPATQYMQDLIDQGTMPTTGTLRTALVNNQVDNANLLINDYNVPVTEYILAETIISGNIDTVRAIKDQVVEESNNDQDESESQEDKESLIIKNSPETASIMSLNPNMIDFVQKEIGVSTNSNNIEQLGGPLNIATSSLTWRIVGASMPIDGVVGINDSEDKRISELTDNYIDTLNYLHEQGHTIKIDDIMSENLIGIYSNHPEQLDKIKNYLKNIDQQNGLKDYNILDKDVFADYNGINISSLNEHDIRDRLENFNKMTGKNWEYAPENEFIYHVVQDINTAADMNRAINSSNMNVDVLVTRPHNDNGLVYMDAQSFMDADISSLNDAAKKLSKIDIPKEFLVENPAQSGLQTSFHMARDGEIFGQAAKNDETYTQTLAM